MIQTTLCGYLQNIDRHAQRRQEEQSALVLEAEGFGHANLDLTHPKILDFLCKVLDKRVGRGRRIGHPCNFGHLS